MFVLTQEDSVSTFRLHLTMLTWLLANFIATALNMGLECWTPPMRNNKMNSPDRKMDSANDRELIFGLGRGPGMLWKWGRASSFRKMDSSDDRELIFGLGRGLVCCGNKIRRVHFEKIDSPDDRELIFGLECWCPPLADQSEARKWTRPTTWHPYFSG